MTTFCGCLSAEEVAFPKAKASLLKKERQIKKVKMTNKNLFMISLKITN